MAHTPRLYDPRTWSLGDAQPLAMKQQHHLRVWRLKEGDAMMVFNGKGQECSGQLKRAGRQWHFQAHKVTEVAPPKGPKLTLVQVIARQKAMDWLVEKATELDVYALQPLILPHTPKSGLAQAQTHWQEKMWSACGQSGRHYGLLIHPPITWDAFLQADVFSNAYVADTQALDKTLAAYVGDDGQGLGDAHIVVGAEAGFSQDQIASVQEKGGKSITLGRHILRAETASIVAVTQWQLLQRMHQDQRV